MKFCSHCGARVMPGMTRCPACGYLLLAPDAPAPDPSPEAADGKTPDAGPDAAAGTPAAGPRSPAPDAPAAEDRPPLYAHPAGALPGLTSAEYLGTLLLFLIPWPVWWSCSALPLAGASTRPNGTWPAPA